MKKLLENTKILSAIMTLGLIAINNSACYGHATTQIDKSYSVVTSVELPSTVKLVRSARMVTDMVKDGNSAALQATPAATMAKGPGRRGSTLDRNQHLAGSCRG